MEVWGVLRQLRGEDATLNKTHDLKEDSVTFGRVPGAGNRVILPFPYVSGVHFTITKKQDASVYITSFGSNGTYLNDELITKGEEVTLSHGDMLSIKYQQKEKLVMEFRLTTMTESAPQHSVRLQSQPASQLHTHVLQSENKAQEKRIQSYIAKMEAMSGELSAAKLEIAALKEHQDTNQAIIEEQRQVILEHESKISAYEAKHTNMIAAQSDMKSQLQQLQTSVLRVSDLELKCSTLQDELHHKTSQYDSQAKIIDSCQATITSLKQQNQELLMKTGEYTRTISDLQRKTEEDELRLQQAHHEISSIQNDYNNTKILLEHAQLIIDQYTATQQQQITAASISAATIMNNLASLQQMMHDYTASISMNTLETFVAACPVPQLNKNTACTLPKPVLPASPPTECTQVHSPVRSQQSHISPMRTQQSHGSSVVPSPQSATRSATAVLEQPIPLVSTPPEAEIYMSTQCDVSSAIKRKIVEDLSSSSDDDDAHTPPESQTKRIKHDYTAATQQQQMLSLGIDNTAPLDATNAQDIDYSYHVSSTTQQQTQYVHGSESENTSDSSNSDDDIAIYME